MKIKQLILIISVLLLQLKAVSQATKSSEDLVGEFLAYISTDNWHIDSVVSKYVVFYKEESPVASKATRKWYLSIAVKELSDALKKVGPHKVVIKPYNEVDEKLQILNLGDDYRHRSFVVTDPSGDFVRYFLIKDNQIEAFVLFKDKAYLLLN